MTLHQDAKVETEEQASPTPYRELALGQGEQISRANERKAEVQALIKAMKLRGNTTLVGLANELNKRGVPALRGGQWTATQVSRLL